VRLLHPRVRDEPLRPVQARSAAVARRRRSRAVRQSLPLHRLPADPRRSADDDDAGAPRRLARPGSGRGRGAASQRRGARARAAAAPARPGGRRDLSARGADLSRAGDAGSAGALRRRSPRRAPSRRRHRPRAPGHQAAAAAGRSHPHRPGRRAAGDPPRRRRLQHRRGRHSGACVRRAGRRLARTARDLGALRLGADTPCRNARRQRRQRLADRRFDAGADRAGCADRAAAGRRDAPAGARGLLSRPPADRAAARRIPGPHPRAGARCGHGAACLQALAAARPGHRGGASRSASTSTGRASSGARIGCGGVAATPRRAVATERRSGRDWNQVRGAGGDGRDRRRVRADHRPTRRRRLSAASARAPSSGAAGTQTILPAAATCRAAGAGSLA
jgi:hypothetical protein